MTFRRFASITSDAICLLIRVLACDVVHRKMRSRREHRSSVAMTSQNGVSHGGGGGGGNGLTPDTTQLPVNANSRTSNPLQYHQLLNNNKPQQHQQQQQQPQHYYSSIPSTETTANQQSPPPASQSRDYYSVRRQRLPLVCVDPLWAPASSCHCGPRCLLTQVSCFERDSHLRCV